MDTSSQTRYYIGVSKGMKARGKIICLILAGYG